MLTQQEKMVFCTLFDSNYLDKGLALYHSMRKHINTFRLYIFAFDDKCLEILSDMHLENAVILSVEDIMTDVLRRIRAERTNAEFCWTCTPIVVEHVLLKYCERICTYIDADIYFFADPADAIQEIIDSGCSVGLVEHRFARNWEYGGHIFSTGKYCIQFNTFLNNTEGMQVLQDWRDKCLDWCYFRYEDGKLGDQKYPDKWKQKYPCIHECQDFGVGVAPWNLYLYSYVGRKSEEIWMECRGRRSRIIFYHFEGIKYLDDGSVYLNIWEPATPGMHRKVQFIYGEYIEIITTIRSFLAEGYDVTFDHMFVEKKIFLRETHSLVQFCRENGLLDGCKKWAGYQKNSIAMMDELSQKRSKRKCFYRKRSMRLTKSSKN